MRAGNKNLLLGTALLGCVAALPAYADSVSTTSGTFTSTSQSEWNTGPGTALNYNSPLLGPSFSASPSIGGITCVGCGVPIVPDTYWGAEAGLDLSGSFGLQVSASLDSGTVNANVPFSSTIDAPNQLINTGHTKFTPTDDLFLGASQLQVLAPTAQASVNLVASLDASGFAKICTGGCAVDVSGTIVNGSTSIPVIAFNSGNSGSTQILGQTTGSLSGEAAFGLLKYSVQGPQNTPLATATPWLYGSVYGPVSTNASTDIADLSFDAGQAVSNALHVPLSGSIGPLDWTLLSSSLSLDAYLNQSFTLFPHVTADLYVPLTGQTDECLVFIGCGAIDVPAGFTGELQVDPTYEVGATFSNNTQLDIEPGFDLSLLSAGISGIGSIGPAFAYSQSYPTSPIDLYSNTFDLEGFNTIDGAPFEVDILAQPQSVPEPSTLALMGICLAGLGLALRRRRV